MAPISTSLPEETPHSSDVDIVIPVYNEAEQLATSITTLRSFLDSSFPFATTITIVDNASTDDTWKLAAELAGTLTRRWPDRRLVGLGQERSATPLCHT